MKNCPTTWQGNFTGHIHEPTIILEAVTLYDLWIWHAFFGLPGSHNDINVLKHSFVFTKLAEGRAPLVNYSINGNNYTMRYYLADNIYPLWLTFVKTILSPQGQKKKVISLKNKRKQGRMWSVHLECFNHILQLFVDLHVFSKLKSIILYNMIIEDGCHINEVKRGDYEQFNATTLDPMSHSPTLEFIDFIRRHHQIRDRETHSQLQSDLVEYLWQLHTNS